MTCSVHLVLGEPVLPGVFGHPEQLEIEPLEVGRREEHRISVEGDSLVDGVHWSSIGPRDHGDEVRNAQFLAQPGSL